MSVTTTFIEVWSVWTSNSLSLCLSLSIIESVDSISRDEQDVPLTQYITNA